MQKPGRAPLKNKSFEALTNGTPLKNDNDNDKEKKTGETRKRPNSEIKTGDRPKGSGRSYSKEKNATKSTTGIIGGNKKFKYINDGKVYVYEPGVQNNNPKTGRRL